MLANVIHFCIRWYLQVIFVWLLTRLPDCSFTASWWPWKQNKIWLSKNYCIQAAFILCWEKKPSRWSQQQGIDLCFPWLENLAIWSLQYLICFMEKQSFSSSGMNEIILAVGFLILWDFSVSRSNRHHCTCCTCAHSHQGPIISYIP